VRMAAMTSAPMAWAATVNKTVRVRGSKSESTVDSQQSTAS
jgi:hypothetical protein